MDKQDNRNNRRITMVQPDRNKSTRLSAPITWLLILLLLLVIAGAIIGVKFLLPGLEAPQPTLQNTPSPSQSPSPSPSPSTSTSPTSTPYLLTTFEVLAAKGWQDTGVQVIAGDILEISYVSGLWTGKIGLNDYSGPEGGHPSVDYSCNSMSHKETGFNALIGTIWTGKPFMVGRQFTGTADISGGLYLRMNDCDEWLEDNEGSVVVTIQIWQ
jgi:hypothetical protein